MNQQNFDNKHSLADLIFEYEAMSQKGTVEFVEETVFEKLIEFFQNKCSYEKALEVVNHALTHYHFTANFHLRKAKLLLALQKRELAMVSLERAECIMPNGLDVMLVRAELYCTMHHYDQALELLDHLKSEMNSREMADVYLLEAHVYESKEDFNKMFSALKNALLLNPDSQAALEKMWLCTELSGRYEESIELHQHLIDIHPYSHVAWYNLGHAYCCMGDYPMAIDAYEYAFVINDKFEFAYRDCAAAYWETKQYQKALDCYLEAAAHSDADCELLVRTGQCYEKVGQPQTARRYLAKAIHIDPLQADAHFTLGESFAQEEKWQSAVVCYERAIDLDNRREEYFSSIAVAYYQLGTMDKAKVYFAKAADTAPELNEYWTQYAMFLLHTEGCEAALDVLDEADVYAFGAELRYCRAACLLSAQRRREGFAALGEGLEEDFEVRQKLFDLLPSLKEDREVLAIVAFYQPM